MKRLLLSAVVVIVLLVSASPAVANAKAPNLKARLLRIEQLPSGWAVVPVVAKGVGCYQGGLELKEIPRTADVKIEFLYKGGLSVIGEELATYAGSSRVAYSQAVSKLASCRKISGTLDGRKVTGSVRSMSFPRFGDESSAFNAIFNEEGTERVEDDVIVRKGSIVMLLFEGNFGTPNVSKFENLVSKAVARL